MRKAYSFEDAKLKADCDRVFGWIAKAIQVNKTCICGPASYNDEPHEERCPVRAYLEAGSKV